MGKLVLIFFIFSIAPQSLAGRLLFENKNTFSVVDYGAVGNGRTDDSKAFLKAWTDVCAATGDITTLTVPQDKTFILKPVVFQGPCKSNSVHFEVLGNISAPKTIEEWNGYNKDKWLQFSSIKGLVIDGKGKGKIDGQGSAWWQNACNLDAIDERYCGNSLRPTALVIHDCDGLSLGGTTHLNSARNHISIYACHGVNIYNLHIVAPEESPNTDGINIAQSTNVNIQYSLIETGDDCIAISGGSSNINITGIACGPGHGISIGSLGGNGEYQSVEEVHVQNCSFKGSTNGARIKTWPGGSGYARKITFEEISFTNTRNPIVIDQFYNCGGKSNLKNQTSAVYVSDVTFKLMHGTSSNEEAITLNCSDEKGCTNIILDHINITSSIPGKWAYAWCHNAHGRSSNAIPSVPCLS